jgi:predicted porin
MTPWVPPVGNDYDAWMIGGQFNMGAMTFKANYMDGEFDNSSADPEQWTLGVDYAMSKRTSVYALYVGGEYINLGAAAALATKLVAVSAVATSAPCPSALSTTSNLLLG